MYLNVAVNLEIKLFGDLTTSLMGDQLYGNCKTGSGRPGAAASERDGGGQRPLVLPLGPVRAGRAVRGPAGRVRIYSPRFLRKDLLGRGFAAHSDCSWSREKR